MDGGRGSAERSWSATLPNGRDARVTRGHVCRLSRQRSPCCIAAAVIDPTVRDGARARHRIQCQRATRIGNRDAASAEMKTGLDDFAAARCAASPFGAQGCTPPEDAGRRFRLQKRQLLVITGCAPPPGTRLPPRRSPPKPGPAPCGGAGSVPGLLVAASTPPSADIHRAFFLPGTAFICFTPAARSFCQALYRASNVACTLSFFMELVAGGGVRGYARGRASDGPTKYARHDRPIVSLEQRMFMQTPEAAGLSNSSRP